MDEDRVLSFRSLSLSEAIPSFYHSIQGLFFQLGCVVAMKWGPFSFSPHQPTNNSAELHSAPLHVTFETWRKDLEKAIHSPGKLKRRNVKIPEEHVWGMVASSNQEPLFVLIKFRFKAEWSLDPLIDKCREAPSGSSHARSRWGGTCGSLKDLPRRATIGGDRDESNARTRLVKSFHTVSRESLGANQLVFFLSRRDAMTILFGDVALMSWRIFQTPKHWLVFLW